MITELMLHPRTRAASQQFIDQPNHSLILVGPAGTGKKTLAINLAATILQLTPEKLVTNPYFLHVTADGSSISIEAIRQTQAFVRLKTTGQATWRRVLLVEDAHLMTTEAQNAFLKLLEEPPADTIIILTTVAEGDLLPTISSRAPKIAVKPVAQAELTKFFSQQSDPATLEKVYHMSSGQIGLMGLLLDNERNQDLLNQVEQAKQFFKAKPFERLVLIDDYLKQKSSLNGLLWALLAVSKAALYQAAKSDKPKLVNHWQKAIKLLLNAQDSLPAHPLPKLLLTDLSLQI